MRWRGVYSEGPSILLSSRRGQSDNRPYMRTRTAAILAGAAAVAFALRHPVELRLLRHRTGPRPDVRQDPIQTLERRDPFEHASGRRRYRIVPRYRWDESAR